MDQCSRIVVGLAKPDHMRGSLKTDAQRIAWFRRKPKPGLIIHTVRGSQYCGDEFTAELVNCKMKPSMSREGDRSVSKH